MNITVEKCLNLLLVRYHDEFIGDVLVEKEKIQEEYMIIKIYSLQDNSCKLPTKEIQQEYRIRKKNYQN